MIQIRYLSKKKVDANNVESSSNVVLSKIPIKKKLSSKTFTKQANELFKHNPTIGIYNL